MVGDIAMIPFICVLNRIQNMMFTRTVITDKNGDPLLDPITGNELVESQSRRVSGVKLVRGSKCSLPPFY